LLADFSTLKMEVIRSSEMSVPLRFTRCHIPEDSILHCHRCENLKSNLNYLCDDGCLFHFSMLKMKAVCSSSMAINFYTLQSIKSQKTVCFKVNTMIITNLVLIRNVSDKILQPNTWPGATEGLPSAQHVKTSKI
jgi:hypothetical protein